MWTADVLPADLVCGPSGVRVGREASAFTFTQGVVVESGVAQHDGVVGEKRALVVVVVDSGGCQRVDEVVEAAEALAARRGE